jgi:hypothetical protein
VSACGHPRDGACGAVLKREGELVAAPSAEGRDGSPVHHRRLSRSAGIGRAIASTTASGLKAATVIDPALGVKPRLGERCVAAREQVVDPTDYPLVSGRPAGICRAVTLPDRSEPDDLRERADGLEQEAALGAEILERVGLGCRAGQAGLAAYAFEVGHQRRFRGGSRTTIHDNQV